MMKDDIDNGEKPVEDQDFAKPKVDKSKKISSHGEVVNQQGGDFSDLEESRMEHPPQHREENGSDLNDLNNNSSVEQSKGIK